MNQPRDLDRRSDDVEVRLVLDHTGPGPQSICLEPWGMVLPLEPDCQYEVFAYGPEPTLLEAERDGDTTTVWAWPGSVLVLQKDGIVVHSETVRFPRTPAGMTVRSFLGFVEGK